MEFRLTDHVTQQTLKITAQVQFQLQHFLFSRSQTTNFSKPEWWSNLLEDKSTSLPIGAPISYLLNLTMYIDENLLLWTLSYKLASTHTERTFIFKMAAEKLDETRVVGSSQIT
jgi:hypothetical protein